MTVFVRPCRPTFKTAMQVVDLAAQLWGVDALRLINRERTRSIAYPRFAVIWALRRCGEGMTWWGLANHLGFRDHKSVIYADKQASIMIENDPVFRVRALALLSLGQHLMGETQLLQVA